MLTEEQLRLAEARRWREALDEAIAERDRLRELLKRVNGKVKHSIAVIHPGGVAECTADCVGCAVEKELQQS